MANFGEKFGSNSQEWETPQNLFNILNSEFHFETDLAASEKNKKCQKFYSSEDNALIKTWNGICWINPPYGSKDAKLKDWVKKAFEETRKNGCTVVMLIPARTNTDWWHRYCMRASEIRFIKGRPKFNDSEHGLPQPLAIIVFRNGNLVTDIKSFDITKPINTDNGIIGGYVLKNFTVA